MLCWGANSVAARLAIGQASPMVIVCLRWAIVAAILAGIASRGLVLAWPELRRSWLRIVLMALAGFSIFNALYYLAAHHTTAVNMSILQGSVPILVVAGALVLHRTGIGLLQLLGIASTLIGVAVVATAGHLATLAAFRPNLGDGLILIACFLYAGYTLALHNRPNIAGLVLFAAMAIAAFVSSLPLLGYEVLTRTVQWPTWAGWLILGFIGLFPSFLAQLSFMRAVQLIGPRVRASLSISFHCLARFSRFWSSASLSRSSIWSHCSDHGWHPHRGGFRSSAGRRLRTLRNKDRSDGRLSAQDGRWRPRISDP